MPTGKPLSDKDVEKMKELKRDGVSLAAIAERFGVTISIVSRRTRGVKKQC